MKHVILGFLLLSVATINAQEHMSEGDVQSLHWRVDSVVSGSLCRLVVTRVEWAEYTTHEVFIQWLRPDHEHYRLIVERTVCVHELDHNYIIETPRFIPDGSPRSDGSFEVVAISSATDTDEYFTITPNLDHTYSVTRSGSLRRNLISMPVLSASVGFTIGVLLTYAKLRSRNAKSCAAKSCPLQN